MKFFTRFLFALIFFFISLKGMAIDFYVSPDGNDLWTGSKKSNDKQLKNGPFKTLERAQLAIRLLKKNHKLNEKVEIHIASGEYILNKPLQFDFIDAGLPDKKIVWEGDDRGEVIIQGSRYVNCRSNKNTKQWDCPLEEPPVIKEFVNPIRINGNSPKFEVFLNGEKLQLSRWPDQDWAHIKKPIDKNFNFSVFESLPDIKSESSDIQVHIFPGNDYFDQYVGVESLDKYANSIKLSHKTAYSLERGNRFYLQNHRSFLNKPGEWFYDPIEKIITLIPLLNNKPSPIIISNLPNLVVADSLSNLTFKNISFKYSTGTALTFKNSRNVILDRIHINNVGGKGLEIAGGENVSLINSKIHHTGEHGVIVSGGDFNNLKPSGHVIKNNHIHHTGTFLLTYTPAIEMNGVGISVSNNLLEEGSGIAIFIKGNDHLIEKNELFHFCMQASDCGAIYTGRNWQWRGNIIRGNYIHDIVGYGLDKAALANNIIKYRSPHDARGIYLDDGGSGFYIVGNIIENIGLAAISISSGRDNKIINNYIKTGSFAIFLFELWPSYNWEQIKNPLKASPYKTRIWSEKYPELIAPMHNYKWPEGNNILRNVIVTTNPKSPTLRYSMPSDSNKIEHNIVWSESGDISVLYHILDIHKNKKVNWLNWLAENIEKDSIFINPCFTMSNKKLNICPNSPVKKIGFVPIATDIGLIN